MTGRGAASRRARFRTLYELTGSLYSWEWEEAEIRQLRQSIDEPRRELEAAPAVDGEAYYVPPVDLASAFELQVYRDRMRRERPEATARRLKRRALDLLETQRRGKERARRLTWAWSARDSALAAAESMTRLLGAFYLATTPEIFPASFPCAHCALPCAVLSMAPEFLTRHELPFCTAWRSVMGLAAE